MPERILRGLPASPGAAWGHAHLLEGPAGDAATVAVERRPAELAAARAALATAGDALDALAARLRAEGSEAEAEIVETGVLMAADPALDAALEAAVTAGRPAPAALVEACGVHADAIAAIPDAMLAARADDVRSLGRRAARIAAGEGSAPTGPDGAPAGPAGTPADLVLIARDLGPADVAELPAGVVAIALAAGGPSAHAAVVARGLGLPMAVGLGDEVLGAAAGEPVVVDGDAGLAALAPEPSRLAAATAAGELRRRRLAETEAASALPAVTRDGRAITVLVNAATAAEVAAGLRAGAEGVGLLRTELHFLDARDWPDADAHRAAVAPVLDALAGRVATVRVLDFGADKTPAFLRDTPARGLALLLDEPAALEAQLRGVLAAGAATDLRILLPLVGSPEDVHAVRAILRRAAGDRPPPPLGAMIETAAAVRAAPAIAAAADFLSIGTNDLTADVLGADRFAGGAGQARDPRVLAAIAAVTAAARAAGRTVEVCGEAASEPEMLPLLVGLGVDELSVGAARVGETRAAVRALDAADAQRLAYGLLGEPGDAAAERLEGGGPVLALRPKA
jgi:phosphoenolpyruvate-protein kinase (PTS system EI component)